MLTHGLESFIASFYCVNEHLFQSLLNKSVDATIKKPKHNGVSPLCHAGIFVYHIRVMVSIRKDMGIRHSTGIETYLICRHR